MSDAILPKPADLREILGDLAAHRQMLEYLHDLANQLWALDLRPVIYHEHHIEHVGELALPENLMRAMSEERQAIHDLEEKIVQMRAAWIRSQGWHY